MKRWLLLVAVGACLWGCSDDTQSNTTTSSGTTSSSSSSSSGGGGGEGGGAPAALVTCIDDVGALPMPPAGKLPCEYIPPGVELAQ